MADTELLPCAFCLRAVTGTRINGVGVTYTLVGCDNKECPASDISCFAERWNTRVSVSPIANPLVGYMEEARDTHLHWAKHFEDHPELEAEYVASGEWDSAETHRKWEAIYNDVIACLSVSPISNQEQVCWHCGVVLAGVSRPRCEDCPDECDEVGCEEMGCAEHGP